MRAWPLAFALVLTVGAPGCKKAERRADLEVDYGLVEVASDKIRIRTDVIGRDEWENEATFVLVDAKNTHSVDLAVTLAGELVDASGEVIGELRGESLRVPAGAHRTFALIESKERSLPNAAGARVKVTGAHPLDYEAPVLVVDGHVHPNGDNLMASGKVVNRANRHVKALVMGTFYDEDGVPLTRPFKVLALDGGTTHLIDFRSPPEAKSGYIFIGQALY